MATLSVCMANFNHGHYLPEALDALLAQSRQPDEIIIVDDASTDNSIDVLERYAARVNNFRLVKNEVNKGVVAVANHLLNLAGCDYFLCIAADDKLLPSMIEQSMSVLEANPHMGLCSSLTRVMDSRGLDVGLLFADPFGARGAISLSPDGVRRQLLNHGGWFAGNTTIYRKSALLECGGFRQELGPFCDEFVSQVIALKYGACFIPKPLGAWRRASINFSSAFYAKDSSALQRIEDEVIVLMHSSEYRGLFSDAYIRRWSARWRYFKNVSVLESDRDRALLRISQAESASGLGRLRLMVKTSWVKIKFFALKFIVALTLRRDDIASMPKIWLRRAMARARGHSRSRMLIDGGQSG